MNTSEIIRYYGYPCENHEVVTEDGYILSIQRIPYGLKNYSAGPRPIVFLQHGLVDSSFTWVNNPPGQSLGYILADNGFDVWLANSRGNVYSRKHLKFSSKSDKFWDFSWDEMVQYDLSASIDYVLKVTRAKKLSYIGHSQGTEIMFAKLGENSTLNNKISSFVSLAPVVYLGNVKTGIRYLAYIVGSLNMFIKYFNHGEFLPSDFFTRELANYVCRNPTFKICENILFLLAGYDISNLNETRVPIYIAHTPAGTSSKNMVHYAQSYESNKFQKYDYGVFQNFVRYHQITPPKYCLNTFDVPLAVFWGGNDWLADPDDARRAIENLGDNVKLNKFIPEYNHMDFIWGINAARIIYPDLINFIAKYQM